MENDPQNECIRWRLAKQVVIPGQPVAKGRPRLAKRGRFTRAYTPEKTVKYEKRVGVFCRGPILAPGYLIRVEMRLIFKRPKRLMGAKHPDGLIPKLTKPDGDNVEKAVLDGLSGVAFEDDAKVFGGSWTKWYAEKKRGPRVEVNIYTTQPAEDTMK